MGRGYTFDGLRAKVLYGTKASKPARFHYYEKEEPLKMADTISFRYSFFNPASTTRHKHIETSAGTDIEILADILERNEF